MNLHENKNEFQAVITSTARSFNIPESFIEKDYWITKCLKSISKDEMLNKYLVFKGGTALSKVFGIINRFSEDIDLSLLPGGVSREGIHHNSGEAFSKIIKKIAPIELEKQQPRPDDSFKNCYKRSFDFPKVFKIKNTLVHGQIVIETSTLSTPEPYSTQNIESYISNFAKQHLPKQDAKKFLDQFDLHSFELKVISVEKTLCEKILAIRRAYSHALETKDIQFYSNRLRHYYDIFHILKTEDYKDYIYSESFISTMKRAISEDKQSQKIAEKVYLSPAIKDITILEQSTSSWNQLKILTFDGKVPSLNDIENTIVKIADILQKSNI